MIQAREAVAALARAHRWSDEEAQARTEIVTIRTSGDRIQDRPLADIGGKGLFAKEIEEALLKGAIDCAIHSLKDLPSLLPPGLIIAAHLPREDPRDALVSPTAAKLADLPQGAIVGTSSVRRRALLLNRRPDLKIVALRGNVDTRLKKLAASEAAATVLAFAGLKRLGAEAQARHVFAPEEMLPSVAQGAIGLEIRADDVATRDVVAAADHRPTALAVSFERAYLAALDGSCKTPIAGLAQWRDPRSLSFAGCVLSPDGVKRIDVVRQAAIDTHAEAEAGGSDAGAELAALAGRDFFTV